jgi:hypothetical protein
MLTDHRHFELVLNIVMNANKSRNVSVLRTSSSKIAKVVQPTSMKTFDLTKRHSSIKETESKEKLVLNQLHLLKKENQGLRALLVESEKVMRAATSKSHKDAASLRTIIEGIWPAIEANITENQKSKIRDTLQIMEDTISKPTYAHAGTQCSESEEQVSATRDKFQSELNKQRQIAEDYGMTLMQLEEKVQDGERLLLEYSRECLAYKHFLPSSSFTIPTFMASMK